jgi:anti-sigma regulatory factor (Ser/Thr protein kinase)
MSHGGRKERTVVLGRDSSAPGLARAALNEFDEDLDGREGDARLVVSELVTNSIDHRDAASQPPIEFSIQLDDVSLCIEVCDPGKGHQRNAVNSPEKPTNLAGLGLAIVHRLADAWGVHRDGRACLWARFDHRRLT